MGSSRSSPQTQTQITEPPAYLQPFLQQGVQGAQNLYQSGGTPTVPFSDQTQQALDSAQNRAFNGSPLVNQAQGNAIQTLSGGFMGKNPYLDDTFNRAAGAVTNQVQSNFGVSGRNARGVDAAGFAADQYNDLATQIYGGNYQAERDRQQQALALAPQLAAQDYIDIGQMANVGAQYDAQAREQAGQPAQNLDDYLSRLGIYGGSTSTSQIPMERNRLAGALGGYQLGSQFGGYGGAVGGILGGLFG